MNARLWVAYCGVLLASTVVTVPAQAQTDTGPMIGFSPQGAQLQAKLEENFRGIPDPETVRMYHRYFTAEPHPAGSARNNELARYIAEEWRRQGWENVTLHRYDVLVSFPREIVVEMVSPVPHRATLREDPYPEDPDTANPRVRQGYLALSASGEVTAPVVYAHSGNPEDYAVLRRHGIDVRGKIALVRYSNPYSYRGFKALTAEREGAAGILIYSDPAEDGFKQGPVYPQGPWGPESHIQRGAITYDFMVAGDPLTPGWASVPGARLLAREEAVSLPKIMAVAMSWRDAKPLLENLGGPEAPQAWQGGLDITYRLGGDSARVHLKVDMDTRIAPNYVVEARIEGSQYPDEWVLLGNHRDAWEFGGVDPSSGTASMMDLSRALGQIKRDGWRPRRTLVLCSWDGEEVGLTGSTEWGEQFAEQLKKKLVAYINVDSSTSGPTFNPSAVASLAPLVVEASRAVTHPAGKSLYEAWKDEASVEGHLQETDLINTRIGSGSDHTVFLNHLGRPTIDLTFTGPYGVYHSMYDNFFWMNRFGDPGYRFHTLLTQLWGIVALRLSQAELLPFDFEVYAVHIGQFVDELESGHTDLGRNVDLKPLKHLVGELRRVGGEARTLAHKALANGLLDAASQSVINRRFMEVEGHWLNPVGIPGRPWFKHMLYAARYTYAHLELPGLTEAVENGDWTTAREQAVLLEEALKRIIALLQETLSHLKS